MWNLKKNIYIYMYVNCIISKVHISSICAVNSHFVFSESFGIFVLCSNLSLAKHINHNLIRRVILTYKDLAFIYIVKIYFCYFVKY